MPDELEYAQGYKARMDVLESKMKPMDKPHSVRTGASGSNRKENYEDPD